CIKNNTHFFIFSIKIIKKIRFKIYKKKFTCFFDRI
ncbi:MAG: hypothetical protein ACI8WA_000732, partial [Polaribacter sp.]